MADPTALGGVIVLCSGNWRICVFTCAVFFTTGRTYRGTCLSIFSLCSRVPIANLVNAPAVGRAGMAVLFHCARHSQQVVEMARSYCTHSVHSGSSKCNRNTLGSSSARFSCTTSTASRKTITCASRFFTAHHNSRHRYIPVVDCDVSDPRQIRCRSSCLF